VKWRRAERSSDRVGESLRERDKDKMNVMAMVTLSLVTVPWCMSTTCCNKYLRERDNRWLDREQRGRATDCGLSRREKRGRSIPTYEVRVNECVIQEHESRGGSNDTQSIAMLQSSVVSQNPRIGTKVH
jgi:hypothetical protein